MPITAREYLMFHTEAEYGTPNLDGGAPRANAHCYVRLSEGNAFNVRAAPIPQRTVFGGGLAIDHATRSKQVTTTGTLRTELCYSQAALLLGHALTRIPTARDLPWATTNTNLGLPLGDLASASFYHCIYHDDTPTRTAYHGGKCGRVQVTCSSEQPKAIATFNYVFSKPRPNSNFGGPDSTAITTTEFPAPAASAFPTDVILFQDSTLTAGTTRDFYSAVDFVSEAVLDPQYFQSSFLRRCRMFGRRTTLTPKLLKLAGSTDRATFEGQSDVTVSLVFTGSALTLTIDMNDANDVSGLEDDLPLEREFQHSPVYSCKYDNSDSGDLSVAVA